ncbi:hypothetical protein TREES_T100011696 [Tupaia chinensis]|uniref:Uncharacterized protein n=1 Tax=Tupaia chinensis TaxID=246437 RepID=L9L5Q3_TUPCH|nr:hypothetical protein TREES_T100011696 [Tupaia chinensis]
MFSVATPQCRHPNAQTASVRREMSSVHKTGRQASLPFKLWSINFKTLAKTIALYLNREHLFSQRLATGALQSPQHTDFADIVDRRPLSEAVPLVEDALQSGDAVCVHTVASDWQRGFSAEPEPGNHTVSGGAQPASVAERTVWGFSRRVVVPAGIKPPRSIRYSGEA